MRNRILPLVLLASSAVVLASCTAPGGGDPVPLPAPTSASTPPASETGSAAPAAPTAETALVAEYLDAVAAGDAAAAWEMLTPEAQESAASFAAYSAAFGRQGTVSPEEASRLGAVEPVVAEGPEGAITLVSAVDGDLADAWIVRATEQGLRLDDHVVPATGATPYEWLNPASGPEEADGPVPPVDVTQAISLAFAAPEGGTEGGVDRRHRGARRHRVGGIGEEAPGRHVRLDRRRRRPGRRHDRVAGRAGLVGLAQHDRRSLTHAAGRRDPRSGRMRHPIRAPRLVRLGAP
jgi:hypothetical protein